MDRQPVRAFEELIVWQKAHAFVLNVYKISRHDLGYSSDSALGEDAAEVGRLLGSYARTLLSPSS
jgi:hypothetical protein